MSDSRFDSRPGTRSAEAVFLGKSPWRPCVRFLGASVVAAVVAAAFAGSDEFHRWLRVDPMATPWAAALCGGAATILAVCGIWTWTARLRWVAISPEGLRWRRGPRARHRTWDQYVGLCRGPIEITVWGQELRAGQYADVEFRQGPSLRITTHTVHGYEELVAEIQATATEAVRAFFPVGGSHCGTGDSGAVSYGPIRLRPNGLEWDGTHHGWDEIKDYEVAVGYLRIQPADGPEFLRRLCELGDWVPVVAGLEANVGPRPVTAA